MLWSYCKWWRTSPYWLVQHRETDSPKKWRGNHETCPQRCTAGIETGTWREFLPLHISAFSQFSFQPSPFLPPPCIWLKLPSRRCLAVPFTCRLKSPSPLSTKLFRRKKKNRDEKKNTFTLNLSIKLWSPSNWSWCVRTGPQEMSTQ